jgi:exopolysaccharide biosynthesis polyprenyl glycosylphosphotransferase
MTSTIKTNSKAEALSEGTARNKQRSRFAKSLSLGVNDILFSVRKAPWMIFDFFLVFALFQSSVWLSPYGFIPNLADPYFAVTLAFTISFVIFSLGLGFYDRTSRFDYLSILRKGTITALLASLSSLMIYYFVFYEVLGRWSLVYGTGGTLFGFLVVKLSLAWVLRRNPYRFTIIGTSPQMQEVIDFCTTRHRSTQLYVHVPWKELFSSQESPTIDHLLGARIGDIVMTNDAFNNPDAIDFAVQALQAKIRVVDEVAFYIQIFERLPIDAVSKAWVLSQGLARRQIVTIAAKRWSDVLLSVLALLVLSPILAAIAIAIKLTSPGPVFFNQPRQGRYSEPFKMYKFRTMRQDDSRMDASGGFTKSGDPRVTSIGKLIRPLHFDELPQLWNIFMGHMSIVGPRPEALAFAKKMRQEIPLYELRYLVRPGLSGHAQVNQGYAMGNVRDTKTKLSYDLYYLCYHSIWLDMQIILKTVFVLTKGAQ